MYADKITESMQQAIDETNRRRTIQQEYNQLHGITPASIVKAIDDVMSSVYERDYVAVPLVRDEREVFRSQHELDARVRQLEGEMKDAARNLDFEKAATLRDRVRALKTRDLGLMSASAR
jgi:excinuclease ABC subunit B